MREHLVHPRLESLDPVPLRQEALEGADLHRRVDVTAPDVDPTFRPLKHNSLLLLFVVVAASWGKDYVAEESTSTY